MKISVEKWFLAADSGGSKTDWICFDAFGKIHFSFSNAGIAALHPGTLPVEKTIREAKEYFSDIKFDAIVLSLGGPNTEEVRHFLEKTWYDIPISVIREASGELIHQCREFLGCNAVVMAGTGVTAIGFQPDGSRRFAEGWGPVYGDIGSGGGIGFRSVQTFLQGIDGITKAGKIAELFENESAGLDLTSFEGRMMLKQRINNLTRKELAALAPKVYALAQLGEPAAETIIQESARSMASLAAAVAPASGKILMLGGIFKFGSEYRSLCEKYLKELRSDCGWFWNEKINISRLMIILILKQNGIKIPSNLWKEIANGSNS